MSERDKFLTEAMGYGDAKISKSGAWISGIDEAGERVFVCSKFSEWYAFGKLITFMDAEYSDEFIADTLHEIAIDGCVQNLPDKLANYLYDYLKDNS